MEAAVLPGAVSGKAGRQGKIGIAEALAVFVILRKGLLQHGEFFLQFVLGDPLGDCEKLVAADSEGLLFAEGLYDACGRTPNDQVTLGMAVSVVDLFQVIDIQNNDIEICRAFGNPAVQVFLFLLTGEGVADTGQTIKIGLAARGLDVLLHLTVHGLHLAADRLDFIAFVVLGLGGGTDELLSRLIGFRKGQAHIAGLGTELFRELIHIRGKSGELGLQLVQPLNNTPRENGDDRSADGDQSNRDQHARAQVLLNLGLIPGGVKIYTDDAGNPAGGVQHRAVGAVEIAPLIPGRLCVHSGGSLRCLPQGIGDKHLFAEIRGILGIGIHGKDKVILADLADGVDIFNIHVVLENRQLVTDILQLRRSDILFLQLAQDVPVQQAGRSVGNIQHIPADQRLNGAAELVDHHGAEYDVGKQHQRADQKHIFGCDTHSVCAFHTVLLTDPERRDPLRFHGGRQDSSPPGSA